MGKTPLSRTKVNSLKALLEAQEREPKVRIVNSLGRELEFPKSEADKIVAEHEDWNYKNLIVNTKS